MLHEDINVTKRITITNGKNYNFFVYDMTSFERQHSGGKFGKGDTVISKTKDYKLFDDESEEMLEVKIRCSKKIKVALEGFEPKESRQVFKKCLKELEARGLVKD